MASKVFRPGFFAVQMLEDFGDLAGPLLRCGTLHIGQASYNASFLGQLESLVGT